MINHSEKAMEYFMQGYNCAQSVVAAFNEEINVSFETAVKLASSFGAGLGRLREVCGAVSGMAIVVGMLYGYDSPKDKDKITQHYKLVQELANKFKQENGSIICKDLLGLSIANKNPVPDDRTKEYYSKRPCKALVGMAAEFVEEIIKKKATI